MRKIRAIHACGMDAHQQVVGTNFGSLDLGELENLGLAEFAECDGFHFTPSCVVDEWPATSSDRGCAPSVACAAADAEIAAGNPA